MNINKIWRGTLVALVLGFVCGAAIAQNAADKTFIMKIATATLNDGQHEWMKRFAAIGGIRPGASKSNFIRRASSARRRA